MLLRTDKPPINRPRNSYPDSIAIRPRAVNPRRYNAAAMSNTPIELTKLEFDLLYALMGNQNIVLDREYLLEHVWGGDEVYQDRTVNVAINRLKEKIDPDKSKDYIKTVRGVGYTLC
jgi:DNA-binding response OmpR family regulator